MNWKYSRYQIVNVILANCHTFDEAYRVCCELEEDLTLAIDTALAESKRAQAKVLDAKRTMEEESERYHILRCQADVEETAARRVVAQRCLDVARDTLRFVGALKALIQPHRKYAHLNDYAAHQACQALEWKLDLVWKTYSMICASGAVSYDHFLNVKMHPDASAIIPVLEDLLVKSNAGNRTAIFNMTKADLFSLCCKDTTGIMLMPMAKLLGDANELLGLEQTSTGIEFTDSGTN